MDLNTQFRGYITTLLILSGKLLLMVAFTAVKKSVSRDVLVISDRSRMVMI